MGVRGRPVAWNDWYSTERWARIRRHQLLTHPLCKFCAERGVVEPATICDHVEPHHGTLTNFGSGRFSRYASRVTTAPRSSLSSVDIGRI